MTIARARLGVAVVVAMFATAAGAADLATSDAEIADAAKSLRARLIETRRDLHMHPELSNRETRTANVVAERLRELGLDDVKTNIGGFGITGLVRGGRPGPVIAVRADMDALPIDETLGVRYRSKTKGVKHACGHDAHVSIALGVAEVLTRLKARLPGTVKFIFQPAEEGAPIGEEGGADLLVRRGVLDNPRPREIFGLHVMPTIDVGKLGFASGSAMASSDHFVLKVRGKKSHGAWPHEGVDAITVSAELVTALQTIRSRRIDPSEPMVLTIGMVHGGSRFNILADEVVIEGTIRALSESTRTRVIALIEQIVSNVVRAHDATYEIAYINPTPVTFNDPKLVATSLPSLERAVGRGNVVEQKPLMVAEDFSFYQKVIPGFYFNLGVRNGARGITALNHTAEFDLDEEALVIGVRAMTTAVVDALAR